MIDLPGRDDIDRSGSSDFKGGAVSAGIARTRTSPALHLQADPGRTRLRVATRPQPSSPRGQPSVCLKDHRQGKTVPAAAAVGPGLIGWAKVSATEVRAGSVGRNRELVSPGEHPVATDDRHVTRSTERRHGGLSFDVVPGRDGVVDEELEAPSVPGRARLPQVPADVQTAGEGRDRADHDACRGLHRDDRGAPVVADTPRQMMLLEVARELRGRLHRGRQAQGVGEVDRTAHGDDQGDHGDGEAQPCLACQFHEPADEPAAEDRPENQSRGQIAAESNRIGEREPYERAAAAEEGEDERVLQEGRLTAVAPRVSLDGRAVSPEMPVRTIATTPRTMATTPSARPTDLAAWRMGDSAGPPNRSDPTPSRAAP